MCLFVGVVLAFVFVLLFGFRPVLSVFVCLFNLFCCVFVCYFGVFAWLALFCCCPCFFVLFCLCAFYGCVSFVVSLVLLVVVFSVVLCV